MTKDQVLAILGERGVNVISIRREDPVTLDNPVDWIVETEDGIVYLDEHLKALNES